MVGELGGDCVTLTTLMGPGVDPHLYRASAGDVRTLSEADIIFYGGLLLEGRMSDVLSRLQSRVATHAVMETVDPGLLLASEAYAGQPDPHLWMDVGLWAQTLAGVTARLAEARPECRESFEANRARYQGELLALHGWVKASLASVPAGRRVLVTVHDAFSYFGRAYEVEVYGIQGISTEAEASLADIQGTVDVIVARQIPAIFVESSVNPRAVLAAVRDRGWELSIGGELYSDAMGARGTWQGSYIGMIRSNVLTLIEALGGQAAPWPDELGAWAERWELN
jgi:manganese/zinc/iron transport system substrate-binding protein